MEASISISPPSILPHTFIGALPSLEETFTPRSFSAFRRGMLGLFLREESPVNSTHSTHRDEIAVKNLSVVPEFLASIASFGALIPLEPSKPIISKSFPRLLIFAPNALHAPMVELVSSERSGFLILHKPVERAATEIALWV